MGSAPIVRRGTGVPRPIRHKGTMARILVVDDDEHIRATVRRILESRGHSVEDVDEGNAGIAAVAQRAPDLVITDIFMPDTPESRSWWSCGKRSQS